MEKLSTELPPEIRKLGREAADWAIDELKRLPSQQPQAEGAPTPPDLAEIIKDLRQLNRRGLQYLKCRLGVHKRSGHPNPKLPNWPEIEGRLYDVLQEIFPARKSPPHI